jgi:hypothetical protein
MSRFGWWRVKHFVKSWIKEVGHRGRLAQKDLELLDFYFAYGLNLLQLLIAFVFVAFFLGDNTASGLVCVLGLLSLLQWFAFRAMHESGWIDDKLYPDTEEKS